MKKYLINENDFAMASQIADRTNQTPAQVLNDFNAFLNDMEKFNDELEVM